ncbi:MAG: hypothetical protein AABW89_04625 [Nanoarchaeota archaeon]
MVNRPVKSSQDGEFYSCMMFRAESGIYKVGGQGLMLSGITLMTLLIIL